MNARSYNRRSGIRYVQCGEHAQYEAAIKAILPVAIKSANDNNTRSLENRFGKN